MDLMTKHLSSLPTGSAIELCYGFMDGQNLMLSGTVTDRDASCLEITDANGSRHYVTLSTVRFFVVLDQPVAKKEVRDLPRHLLQDEPIEHYSLKVSDSVLKDLFAKLGREEKKLLQRPYDSFLYGISSNSADKRRRAAEMARAILHQELEQDYDWTDSACLLVADMLCRENIYDPGLFALAGDHIHAAICACKAQDWLCAGVQATQALSTMSASHEMYHDMLVALETACIRLEDVSALDRLRDVDRVIRDLLTYKEAPSGSDPKTALATLAQLYPNTHVAQMLKDEAPEAPTQELTGIISKILWANETGTITVFDGVEEQIWPFRYADVTDPALLQKIRKEGSALAERGCVVRFVLKNGTALQITKDRSALTQAQDGCSRQDYAQVCWYCRQSVTAGQHIPDAMMLMVEAALSDGTGDLMPQTADFCEDHKDLYPTHGKFLSTLAQLYRELQELPEALRLVEQALKDSNVPDKLRATFLAQYCNYAMSLYNETGDQTPLGKFPEYTSQWLHIFHDGHQDDPNFLKRHSRVLRWRIRGLLYRGNVAQAEETYATLLRSYPADPKLSALSAEIRQARQKQLAQRPVASAPQPEIVAPVPEPEEDRLSFEAPQLGSGTWEELGMTEDEFLRRVLAMDGDHAEVAQTAALNAAALLAPGLKKVAKTMSAAVDDPMTDLHYDTRTLTDLISVQDERYALLDRYADTCVYLRSIFRQASVPSWIRTVFVTDLPSLDKVIDLLISFAHQTHQPVDRYAAYRDRTDEAREAELATILSRARKLYDSCIAVSAHDNGGRKFARFVDTKQIAYDRLADFLCWVLHQDRDGLLRGWESYSGRFLNSDGNVCAEKVDRFIIDCWEQAGKDYPSGDGEDLQGSRRNTLRCSIRTILTVVNDYRLWLDRQDEAPRTAEGEACYAGLLPKLEEALGDLIADTHEGTGTPEERTGLRLLERTATELLDKLTGHWQQGQERWFYSSFLQTGLVALDDRYLPDMTVPLTGPLGLIEQIFAHDRAQKLTAPEHMARIFSREHPGHRNFDTAELLSRMAQLRGQTLTMPDPQRYIDQSRLMAELEFQELRESLRTAGQTALEQQLLWLYDHCLRKLRFGQLHEGMSLIRSLLERKEGEAA